MTEDPDSQFEIFAFGHTQAITEEDLRKNFVRCREISQGISKQIAIIDMGKMRKQDG